MGLESDTTDSRLAWFSRLLGLGFIAHVIQAVARSVMTTGGLGAAEFFRQAELYAWTPGLFPPNGINLLVNWFLFTLLAVCLMLGMRSKWIFSLLLAVAISHFFALPFRVSNHYLMCVWSIGLLAMLPLVLRKSPSDTVNRTLIVLLRHLMCITYFFAVLHKLNTSFLSPETTSLKVVVPPVLFDFAGLVGLENGGFKNGMFTVLIYATLLTELALPFLLVYKRTRIAGWLLGLIFHGLITYLAGVSDYTIVILSFYILFLDRDDREILWETFRTCRWSKVFVAVASALVLESLPLFIGTGLPSFPDRFTFVAWLIEYLTSLSVLTMTGYCLIAWTPLLFTGRRQSASVTAPATEVKKISFWRSMPTGVVAIIVVLDLAYLMNGFSPYLGLKYFYSQAMYSNLQTDSTGSNHLFLPHIGLFQNDVFVRISLLEFTPPVSDEELRNNRGLQLLLESKDQSLVEKNFLVAVLGNACRKSEHNVSIRMMEIRSGVTMKEKELTCTDLEKMHSRPLNFYPWFIQSEAAASKDR